MVQRTEHTERALELFQTLAHPVRLRLLLELCREDECVCHLSAVLDRPQPYISQQLAELRDAGLVMDRRGGERVFYHLIDQQVRKLIAANGLCATGERTQVEGCACPKCN